MDVEIGEAYKTKQSFGKACSKTRNSLPQSKQRQKIVVTQMVHEIFPELTNFNPVAKPLF